MHHGRGRSSLLPAVTLGARDKEPSSKPARITLGKRAKPPPAQPRSAVRSPEHQASSPFSSQRVFTLRRRAGPQPKISLSAGDSFTKTRAITVFGVNNQLRSAEDAVQTAIAENHRAEKYSQDLFVPDHAPRTGWDNLPHFIGFSSRQHSANSTTFPAQLSGHAIIPD